VRVLSAKAVDRRYPYTRLGRFDSSDPLLNDIWRLGVQTVELCSEDAYVDCADRERAQWMADGYMMSYPVSRVALAGPGSQPGTFDYCDSRLLRNMLRHMAYSQLPDGRLQPMRPSMYPPDLKHGVIDDYTCLWVQALRELHERTGDAEFASEVLPVAVKAMDYFLDRRSNRGLVYAQEFLYFKNPLAYVGCEGTTVNSFIYQALRDAGFLGVRLGQSEARFLKASQDLRHAVNDELWDEAAGSYSGGIVNGQKTPPTAHAALIALYYQIVPPDRVDQVYRFLLSRFEQESPFPYTYRYFFDVLYKQDTEAADRLALETMRKKWQSMTGNTTGAASESWGGYSYMHESGAHPAYFLSAYVLGVRNPARQLIIQPRLGGLERAEGVVVTEFGPVSVSWKFADARNLTFEIEVPRDVVADVSIPVLSPGAEVVINDRRVTVPNRARFARTSIGHGPHSGHVTPR
jgi:hypothetical protein